MSDHANSLILATHTSAHIQLLHSQVRATRSGKDLPTLFLTRGDQHRWSRADRSAYSGVKVWYNNIKIGHRSSVLAGISGRAKELRTTHSSEAT